MTKIEIALLLSSALCGGLAAQVREPEPAQVASPGPAAASTPQASASQAFDPPELRLDLPAPQVPAATPAEASSAENRVRLFEIALPDLPPADPELEARIQNALDKDPVLSRCGLTVTATAEAIDVAGSAPSSRERLSAWRIAESYAHGKRVVNHIVVSGAKDGDSATAAPAAHPAPAAAVPPARRNERP